MQGSNIGKRTRSLQCKLHEGNHCSPGLPSPIQFVPSSTTVHALPAYVHLSPFTQWDSHLEDFHVWFSSSLVSWPWREQYRVWKSGNWKRQALPMPVLFERRHLGCASTATDPVLVWHSSHIISVTVNWNRWSTNKKHEIIDCASFPSVLDNPQPPMAAPRCS